MVTVQRNFSAVTNAVATVNDRWPNVILSAEYGIPYYVKIIFVKFKRCWRSSKLREHAFTLNRGQRFIFVRYFNIMHYVNIIIFRRRNIFRVIIIFLVCIVNWFTKISFKFGVGFNNNELFGALFNPFHCITLLSVLVQQAREFLSHDKKWKGKILLQHSMQYQSDSPFVKLAVPKSRTLGVPQPYLRKLHDTAIKKQFFPSIDFESILFLFQHPLISLW